MQFKRYFRSSHIFPSLTINGTKPNTQDTNSVTDASIRSGFINLQAEMMNRTLDKLSLGNKLGVIFEQTETIKWTGKPNLKSYLLNVFREIIIGLFYIMLSMLFFVLIGYLYKTTISWTNIFIFFGIAGAISICGYVWRFLKFMTTTYIVTDISIIIHCNFTSSTKTIQLRDIQKKELKKTFIEKHLKTGTISLYTGATKENDGQLEKVYDHLSSIKESEFVYSLF